MAILLNLVKSIIMQIQSHFLGKSMYITNIIGDSMLPWRTPDYSPLPMFVLTLLLLGLYVPFIAICRYASSMHSAIAIHSFSLGTLSKAFSRSRKKTMKRG